MDGGRPSIGIPVRLPAAGTHATPEFVAVVQDLFDRILDLIRSAGAVPVLLDADLHGLDRCQGFVVPGGGDIDPVLYGGPVDDPTLSAVSREQDELDSAVIRFALEEQRPLLAICRGMQLLNVVVGGTLHVDVDQSTVVHHLPLAADFEFAEHEVQLVEGTRCAAVYGAAPRIPVTSGHHQAVDRVATGLRAAAFAQDGLVEALESADPATWTVGIQWHPELDGPDGALRLPLFAALVDAVREAESERAAG